MLIPSQYGLGAVDPFTGALVLGPGDVTVTPDPGTAAAINAAINAGIAAGYTDSSASVDPNTGLPLYVPSGTNPNPIPCGTGFNPTPCPSKPMSLGTIGLIGGGVLLLVLVMSGGRRR